jgi:hypothetical protein
MTPPTPEEERNYHLDRIASSLEHIGLSLGSLSETARLSYEMNIDTAAKTNALTDGMSEMLSSGLSGLLGTNDDE